MNTATKYNTQVNTEIEESTTSLKIGMGLAAIVGLWGVACLIGGLFAAGLVGTVTGFIAAITGM